MLIKIYWKCSEIEKEVYTLRKSPTKIVGFTYPIALKDDKYLPHWTYHADENRKPKIHHRSRSGRVLDFMTLEGSYLKRFDGFEGVVWSVPSLGTSFSFLHAINVEGYPEEAQRKIIFSIDRAEIDWTHYLHILLIERAKYVPISKATLSQVSEGYNVISSETVDDGQEPNILVVFSKNKTDEIDHE